MKREYLIILIVYIVMLFSSLVGVPLLTYLGSRLFTGYHPTDSVSLWVMISFSAALFITLFLLRKEIIQPVRNRNAIPFLESVYWAIGGIFLAFFAQLTAANLEYLLGIDSGSENTQQIIELIRISPIIMIVTSIIGPILEEIVFRKIIFGSLYPKMKFFLAALISSLIFAIAHGEPEHLILYSAMGFTFAFLYVKTKRILVPIAAHVSMNTIVVILQFNQNLLPA